MPKNNCGQYVYLFINGYVKARGIEPKARMIVKWLKFKSTNKANKHKTDAQKIATLYAAVLCLLALFVLLNFNHFTIILALGSMPLAFTYPLMKRYTYWPQLFLGITFNYGLILGWTAIKQEIDIIPLLFYFGAIFWTLGYDTIYGFQDIKDDEIIGLKSTAIKFKSNPIKFLITCYSVFFFTILMIGFVMNFNYFFYLSLAIVFLQIFYFQLKILKIDNAKNCLKIFKSNNFLGLLVFFGIFIGKF